MIAWIVAAACFGALLRVIWVGARRDVERWREDARMVARLRTLGKALSIGVAHPVDADTLREVADTLEARATDGE